MKQLTDATFDREVLRSDRPVIVAFQAPWSAASTACVASLERVSGEYEGDVPTFSLNVDDDPIVVSHYDLRQLPALALYSAGAVVATHEGMISEDELRALYERALAPDA
jgi:thioredoxin 1